MSEETAKQVGIPSNAIERVLRSPKVWKVETVVCTHWFKTLGAAIRFAGKNRHWQVKEGSESETCWVLTKHQGCNRLHGGKP